MEEKCSSPGCTRPAEYSCSCADAKFFLCESHLSWHISSRKKQEHIARRIIVSAEPDNKDCQLCLRKPSRVICLCRGAGVKLCSECFDLHSVQSSGRHNKEPIEAAEFVKDERDVYAYIERRDQIDAILKVVKDNEKEIQTKEEMFRIFNTKIMEKLKKWYEEKLVRIAHVKKALKQFEEEIKKCKFKKDITGHWVAGLLKEKDYSKHFKTVKMEFNEEILENTLKSLLILEQEPILVQHTDLNKTEVTIFVPEKDSTGLYQRIQSTFSDHGSRMIPKLNLLFTKALEPSLIEGLLQVELANCMLGITGCRHLGVVLPAFSRLNYLNLSSNSIGPSGARELAPAISQLKNLTTLLIAWNKLENKGIEYLSEALPELSSLKNLQLSWNDISETGAQFLARGLVQCDKLEKLELWNNPIGPEGMRNLILALPYLVKLKTLDLNKTELGPEGAEALAIALPRLTELTNLCVASNNIGASGINCLTKAISGLKNLQVIDLARNSIKSDGAQSIQEAMLKLQKDTTIILNGNTFNKEDRTKLRNCASSYGLHLN